MIIHARIQFFSWNWFFKIWNPLGITDADSEDTSNSVVKLICDEISSPEACETFDLKVQGLPGDYRGM